MEAREIMQMDLSADLAVLAGQTGRGRISRGEGLVGMSWTFLAGCPMGVASQWNVKSQG